MPYIGNDLDTIVKQGKKVYEYVATAGQTVFTGNDSNGDSLVVTTSSFVNVFLNGIRLIVTDDYTVSANTITLTSGASLNDELVIVADIEAATFNTYTRSETDTRLALKANSADVYTQAQVSTEISNAVNGLVDSAPGTLDTLNELAAALGDDANFASTVTNALNARYTSTEVDNLLANINSVQVSGTEPTDKSAGLLWYNTGNNTLYVADGVEYFKVSAAIPTLTGVSGTIYAGAASTLTLSGTNFLLSNLTVTFTFNSTDYDVTVTPSSDASAAVAVPSGLYNVLTSGDNVVIKVTNSDSVSSNTQNKSATGLPTGGTIYTHNGYRVHAFTSSSNFVIPSGFTNTLDVMIVAGGGGGGGSTRYNGAWSGGGGAGGLIFYQNQTISPQTLSASIGSGGGVNSNGGNSSFNGWTAIGGGRGGGNAGYAGASGGSGGGGLGDEPGPIAGGAGTSGQGYAGGPGTDPGGDPYYEQGGGGGGAEEAGNTDGIGFGGDGADLSSYFGTSYGESGYFAGGGAGGSGTHNGGTVNEGGLGGGGDTQGGYTDSIQTQSGAANTGGGGSCLASGGSGIVIIRYQL